MAYINSIGLGLPKFKHQQSSILQFMSESMEMNALEQRMMRLLYAKGGVKQRYSVVPDYDLELSERQLYPEDKNLLPFPAIEKRMELYLKNAPELAQNAILDCIPESELASVTHLITVSCTGLSAPGIDIMLMQSLNLRPNLVRTSVNFMGCYAAIHGLKIADAFVKQDPNAKVLVVCVELCTLHFQREKTQDNLIANLLFADGAAAVLVSNLPTGFKINSFYSKIATKGITDMAWQVSSTGFLMTLSTYVPDIIEEEIKVFLEEASVHSEAKISHYAIHPGGKKIIEAIQKSLNLSTENVQNSLDVLQNFGNMSSPTILFVLKKIMDTANKNENVFGVAFGPGLTMESFNLTKI